MAEFIQISGLRKIYKVGEQYVEALKGVDLTIEKSDFAVFMGHSGSGKTTLVSTIGGLTRPSNGSVYIDGTDIWKYNDRDLSAFRNKKIGFMFQSFSLLPTLDVLNNIIVPVIFRRNGGEKDTDRLKSKAVSLLSDLGIGGKIHSFPSELSGGEQRRVAIARALINDPEIILADEPTGELDIRNEREVIDIFRHINELYGKTVIVVSHSLTWIDKAKTIIIMKEGRMHKNVKDPVKELMGASPL